MCYENIVSELMLHLNIDGGSFKKLPGQMINSISLFDSCLLLCKGCISVHRTSDDVLIKCVHSPYLFGVDTLMTEPPYYLKALSKVEYEVVSKELTIDTINKYDLWHSLSMYLILLSEIKVDYISRMSGVSTKNLIKVCYSDFHEEPEVIREFMTVSDYIMARTNLARSTVVKALAEYKKH